MLNYLAFMGVALGMFLAAVTAYVLVTPIREFSLIKAGNNAAAASLAGALVGIALPIASTMAHAVSLLDLVIWAAVAAALQIVVFVVVDFAFKGLRAGIEQGSTAHGVFLGSVHLAIGLLNAGGVTY